MLYFFLGFLSASVIVWTHNKVRPRQQRYTDVKKSGQLDLSGTRFTNSGVQLRRVR